MWIVGVFLTLVASIVSTAEPPVTYEYSYEALLKSNSPRDDFKLKESSTFLLTIFKTSKSEPVTRKTSSGISVKTYMYDTLLHVSVNLKESGKTLSILAQRTKKGFIENIFMSREAYNDMDSVNHVKGILSLMHLDLTLESQKEIDINGECDIYYGVVDSIDNKSASESDSIMVDKEYQNCKPLIPHINDYKISNLDAIGTVYSQQSLARLYISSKTGDIYKAHLESNHMFSSSLDKLAKDVKTNLNLFGVQNLIRIRQITELDKSTRLKYKRDGPSLPLDTIQKKIESTFGKDYVTTLLSPSFPMENITSGCSLHTNLHISDVESTKITTSELRQLMENYRDALQPNNYARIQFIDAGLKLLRQLRCLPIKGDSSDILAKSLLLDKLESKRDFDNFLRSWKINIPDILINCGTDLCINTLIDYLKLLVNHLLDDKVDVENSLVNDFFKVNVWTALTNIQKPTEKFLFKLHDICRLFDKKSANTHYLPCVLVEATLYNRFTQKKSRMKQEIYNTIERFLKNNKLNAETEALYKERVVAGLLGAQRISDAKYAPIIYKKYVENEKTDQAMKILAINTLFLLKLNHEEKRYYVTHLANLLMDRKLNISVKLTIVNQLLTSDISGMQFLFYFNRAMETSEDLNLQASSRHLIDAHCKREILSPSVCHCYKQGGNIDASNQFAYCDSKYLSGWLPLIPTNISVYSQNNILFEDDSGIAIDYSLHVMNNEDHSPVYLEADISVITDSDESVIFELFGLGNPSKSETTGYSSLIAHLKFLKSPLNIYSIPTGIMDNLLGLLMSSGDPTRHLSFLRLPIDKRSYEYMAGTFPIRIENYFATSAEIKTTQGAESIWSQKGFFEILLKAGFVMETVIKNIQFNDKAHIMSTSTNMGIEIDLNYRLVSTIVEIKKNICSKLHFNKNTGVKIWTNDESFMNNTMNQNYKILKSKDLVLFEKDLGDKDIDLGEKNAKMCAIIDL